MDEGLVPLRERGDQALGSHRPDPALPSYTHSRKKGFVRTYLPPVVLIAVLVGLWEGAVVVFDVQAFLVPRPSAIAKTIWERRASLLSNGLVTVREVLLGFSIALAAGVLIATMIAESNVLRRAVYPLVVASQTVPVVAIAPVIVIWFGYGTLSKIVVAAFISFFPIVVNTATGLASLDADIARLMRSFPASRSKIFVKARVPAAMPYLFAGMKIGIVLSVIGAVVGELVGSDTGLGHFIVQQNALLQTTVVFAAIFALSIIGVALFLLVSLGERIAIPWYFEARGYEHR